MDTPANPTARRRQLAVLLRDARLRAGITIEQVAQHLLCSSAKISRLETGQRAASLRDVRDLCDFYGIGLEDRENLMALAKESRLRGWWESYNLPETYASYIGFEAVATSIRDFKSSIVPGLLETEDYARALIESYFSSTVDSLIVEGRVRARMERQAAVFGRDNPPHLHSVMDEAVLHRVVGGPAVMYEQLDRLAEIVRSESAQIQIVPFRAGAHPCVETTFTILDFDEKLLPSIVLVEDVFGDMQIDRPGDLERSRQIFERTQRMALSPEDSLTLIASVREGYTT